MGPDLPRPRGTRAGAPERRWPQTPPAGRLPPTARSLSRPGGVPGSPRRRPYRAGVPGHGRGAAASPAGQPLRSGPGRLRVRPPGSAAEPGHGATSMGCPRARLTCPRPAPVRRPSTARAGGTPSPPNPAPRREAPGPRSLRRRQLRAAPTMTPPHGAASSVRWKACARGDFRQPGHRICCSEFQHA